MSAAHDVRSLAVRLGLERVSGTFVRALCGACGHDQHHWVRACDVDRIVTCAECGKAAIARVPT